MLTKWSHRALCALLVILSVALGAGIQPMPAYGASQGSLLISWSEASMYVGQVVTVEGPVSCTGYADGVGYISLGLCYPDPDRFTVAIPLANQDAFIDALGQDPLDAVAGATIQVTGTIELYLEDEPIIWLRDPDQLVVNPLNPPSLVDGEYAASFPDPGLEAAIRSVIGKATGDIQNTDLIGLTVLDASSRDIVSIEGIQHCIDLTLLDLHENQIVDISPLEGLIKLTKLWLWVNEIVDISPLEGLTNLTELLLDVNQIVDISPLESLTNLTELWLNVNQIVDITALSGLSNLMLLRLDENQIVDIAPLESLTNLTVLGLWESCPIQDEHEARGVSRAR